jgi:hypothetical protein
VSDRTEEFSMRLLIEMRDRFAKCEDFAATPSSILLAVVNAIAHVREEMGFENPLLPDQAWRYVRKEDLP